MNETTKSIIFVAVAAVSVAGAFLGRPGRVGKEAPDEVGQAMFSGMEDSTKAQSLEVVEYDDVRGKTKSFSVVQRQGLWTLPSNENYPADAVENLEAAANMFVNLEVINVASEEKSTHIEYGVVEPSDESKETEGVGKLVRIKDAGGERLVEVVIGKEVPESAGQRFVRRPGQDRVYTVELDADKLSTNFEDWIEQDVLELEAMNIRNIIIRDYSVELAVGPTGRPQLMQEPRMDMQVNWNTDDFKWELQKLMEFRNSEMMPTQLLDDEELDSDVLNELKNALADLKIVDVAAKPEPLRQGLKGNVAAMDMESRQSLFERGFYPVGEDEDGLVVASTDGEVVVQTDDHMKYELYFGKFAGGGSGGKDNSINRYVMIAAKVDKESISQPELAEVPDAVGPASPSEDGEEPEMTDEQKKANEERDAIIKENERKQNEYDETLSKAQEKVDELNFRLADWYYVISEDVYNDIHLSRKDVVSTKEGSADTGFGADAFHKLLDEGLKRDDSAASGAPGAPGAPSIPGIGAPN